MSHDIPHFEGITDGPGASCCLKHLGEPVLHYQAIAAARTALPLFTTMGWTLEAAAEDEGTIQEPATEYDLYMEIKQALEVLLDSPEGVALVNGPHFSVWKSEEWGHAGARSAVIVLRLV